MAYVVWRVLMKKYSRVRLGIHKAPQIAVTPTGRPIKTYDEDSWRVNDDKDNFVTPQLNDNPSTSKPSNHRSISANPAGSSSTNDHKESSEDLARNHESRQSKAKRVKNYLKKCKNALGSLSAGNSDPPAPSSSNANSEQSTSSWYVDKKVEEALQSTEESSASVNPEEIFEKVHLTNHTSTSGSAINNNKNNNHLDSEILAAAIGEDGSSSKVTDGSYASGSNNVPDTEGEASCVGLSKVDDECALLEEKESSPPLPEVQGAVEGRVAEGSKDAMTETKNEGGVIVENQEAPAVNEVKCDVASLVDRFLGPLYVNYSYSRPALVRQARDLLVCEYHGSLVRFEEDFCIPAAKLLGHLLEKNKDAGVSGIAAGWPLCVGAAGVIVHLGPLAPALLRNRDCYLCVRGRSAPGLEVALVWRSAGRISCRTVAEFYDPTSATTSDITSAHLATVMDLEMIGSSVQDADETAELPELLQNLLVSVEHAIERVPLDELAFPCGQCGVTTVPLSDGDTALGCSCQCLCSLPEAVVLKKDTSIQTSPMFEFAGSIPHIDSDEDDDKESLKSGNGSRKIQEIFAPKQITDIPEKLLMSGINLPGTQDIAGRPIILCDAACIARAGLNRYEIATLLLYYASLPSHEYVKRGFTILLLDETCERIALESLDRACALLLSHVIIHRMLIWRPGKATADVSLPTSRIQVRSLADEQSLEEYIDRSQSPASCGGSSSHDQLEWVEFFRQVEPFLVSSRLAGRALLSALAQLRSEEVPQQITRRFLHHQHRQITRALQDSSILRLRREGPSTIAGLEERAQWLAGSSDVQQRARLSNTLYQHVDRVSKRLEQLAVERREKLKELARLRTLQDEVSELLSWLHRALEDTLQKNTVLLRTAADSKAIKDLMLDFEKFYFIAMRHIDKAGDLIEESNNIPDTRGKNLKDKVQLLKQHTRAFSERLEEARERLEDSSRCFQLLETCQDNPDESPRNDEDMVNLAIKCGNEKLLELCRAIPKSKSPTEDLQQPPQPQDKVPNETCPPEIFTSTPNRALPGQIRRRSVSSFAFIYKCNHHAAGVSCSCNESEENSVSANLKKKYVQSMQNTSVQTCGCLSAKDVVDRKNSLGLDGIKEVRESLENLLEANDDKNDSGLSGCGRCDSGVSRGNSSVGQTIGEEHSVYKKRLQRTCSCQFYGETCTLCGGGSSSSSSNADNQQDSVIEEGCDGFNNKSSHDELEDHYNNDRNKAIPPVPVNSHLHCHASTLDLQIPTDTLECIDPKTKKTLLLVMREMIQTERDYVHSLDYIIENYIPELSREDIPQVLRGQRNVVFGNVEKIYEFHSQQFLRELEEFENHPVQVGQTFLKHKNRFNLYALYNKNKPKSDSLMSEYGTTFFKSKQLELGDKMDLASYLLKPVQRMGKYALLLQQLMKACPPLPANASERAITELEDLKAAEEMVRFQLRHGNDLLAMDSIRECDVNLKEQGRLLRQNEFLVWEGRGKKSLRQVFLFEDLILFSKAKRLPDRKNLDLYIYKNSIKMTDIGLTAKIDSSSTKFEIWFRKRKPNDTFILQSMSEDVKKAWAEELSTLLWKQAMRNREVRLQEMSSMGIGNKPCLDIRPSADQISDRSISIAQLTKTAPRFRNSIVGPVSELYRSTKRPHSVISVSSVSSSSTSSAGSATSGATLSRHHSGPGHIINLNFDSAESPRPHHRSATLNSQCSMESGIIADMSLGSDDCAENLPNTHWPLEKSNSQHSNSSATTTNINSTPASPSQPEEVSLYHVPEELPINI